MKVRTQIMKAGGLRAFYNRFAILFVAFVFLFAMSGCVLNQQKQVARAKRGNDSKEKPLMLPTKDDLIKRYMEDAQCAIAERNYGIAMGCYRKACDLGSALAKYKMGLAYFEGVMVGKDVDEGLNAIRVAALMGSREASEFLKKRQDRVSKLLDTNAQIREWYGISIGQVVRRQDIVHWDVKADVYEKYAAEGRWITILPPKHPQATDMKIHIHLDIKARRIIGIRAYVPVKVNGKGREVFKSITDTLLEPFEKIAGCSGEYYESTDSAVTKGLKLVDSENENWLKISYTTRYFGSHLELEACGTCFSEFCDDNQGAKMNGAHRSE